MKDFRIKPRHPVSRHSSVPSAPVETCQKCSRELDPSKYHDCGEQPSLWPESADGQ